MASPELEHSVPQGGSSLSPSGPVASLGSFPPSQGEHQLGAPHPRSVKEGTGMHVLPRVGAVDHCWDTELGAAGGMSSITREERSAVTSHLGLETLF